VLALSFPLFPPFPLAVLFGETGLEVVSEPFFPSFFFFFFFRTFSLSFCAMAEEIGPRPLPPLSQFFFPLFSGGFWRRNISRSPSHRRVLPSSLPPFSSFSPQRRVAQGARNTLGVRVQIGVSFLFFFSCSISSFLPFSAAGFLDQQKVSAATTWAFFSFPPLIRVFPFFLSSPLPASSACGGGKRAEFLPFFPPPSRARGRFRKKGPRRFLFPFFPHFFFLSRRKEGRATRPTFLLLPLPSPPFRVVFFLLNSLASENAGHLFPLFPFFPWFFSPFPLTISPEVPPAGGAPSSPSSLFEPPSSPSPPSCRAPAPKTNYKVQRGPPPLLLF